MGIVRVVGSNLFKSWVSLNQSCFLSRRFHSETSTTGIFKFLVRTSGLIFMTVLLLPAATQTSEKPNRDLSTDRRRLDSVGTAARPRSNSQCKSLLLLRTFCG